MIDQAKINSPIRLAVVGAGRGLVLDGLQQAKALGLVEPCLIGNASEIADLAKQHGWDPAVTCIAAGDGDTEAAAIAARLVRDTRVDAIMKGNIHTDVLMRALLSEASGLTRPGPPRESCICYRSVDVSKTLGHYRCGSQHLSRSQC